MKSSELMTQLNQELGLDLSDRTTGVCWGVGVQFLLQNRWIFLNVDMGTNVIQKPRESAGRGLFNCSVFCPEWKLKKLMISCSLWYKL